jgi:cytochrome P450
MPVVADLYDPDGYVDGPPHTALAELRHSRPVYWQATPDGGGYWAVLRHADVVHVARHPELYSASEGGVVIENLDPERLAMMRNMVLAMDPPRHGHYRRPLTDSFKAKVIAQLEGRIRAICRSIFERVAAAGEVDFVHDVCAHLPSQVIGELMGLPREDWPDIHKWAEMCSGGQDPDINPGGYDPTTGDVRSTGSVAMVMYAMQFAAARRASATQPEDLTTLILNREFEGRPMSDVAFGSFFNQLVTAGNDTTRTMLSSGLHAFLQHPEQLAELRADPGLLPGAIEEVLRWANPLHYFRRTALRSTVLNGTAIAAGDRVAMMYTSANRDEAVFDRPDTFDIRRDPNPHLSFGIAGHFCLGVHLARLEGRVFFEELLATFRTIDQVGPAQRQRSNLNNALKALPVRLVA